MRIQHITATTLPPAVPHCSSAAWSLQRAPVAALTACLGGGQRTIDSELAPALDALDPCALSPSRPPRFSMQSALPALAAALLRPAQPLSLAGRGLAGKERPAGVTHAPAPQPVPLLAFSGRKP